MDAPAIVEQTWCKRCGGLRPVQVVASAERTAHGAQHVTGYMRCDHHFSVITSERGLARMREQVRR